MRRISNYDGVDYMKCPIIYIYSFHCLLTEFYVIFQGRNLMIRRSRRVILPCTLGSRTLTLAPPVAANGVAPVMAMSMFHTSSPISTVRNMSYCTVIILLKCTACYSNPIHVFSNVANCSLRSSSCPFSVCAQKKLRCS